MSITYQSFLDLITPQSSGLLKPFHALLIDVMLDMGGGIFLWIYPLGSGTLQSIDLCILINSLFL